MILADLGADVIMVEAPLSAGARQAGGRATAGGESSKRDDLYQILSRNKRGITLNLRSEKARQIFCQLAETADVIVEGFRPGAAKRLNIDYEAIAKINPRIIYCSITAYGQDGPYRDLPGHDINSISMAGVLNLIGSSGGPPIIPLTLIGDFGGAGMHAAVGILSALIARGKTGKGQFIDVAMTDTVISLLTFFIEPYFRYGVELKRGETVFGGAYPYYNVYETKDGKFISFGCMEPWIWENLCREIGREDFIPFHVEIDHLTHKPEDEKWEEISSYLKQLFLTKTRDEWFEILSKKNICVAKVYSLDEVFSDPQVLHRKMIVEVEHPTEGKIKQPGIAIKLSDTPGKISRLPPSIGEHTEEILTELGYNKQSIDELSQDGAIG